MPGPLQGADEILIETPPHRVFAILDDARRLPEWTSVISTSGNRETVGAVRECEVDLDGKRGNVVERCIEANPPRRIAWAMEQDTFGFSRLVSDFGFSFTLERAGDGATRVQRDLLPPTRDLLGSHERARDAKEVPGGSPALAREPQASLRRGHLDR